MAEKFVGAPVFSELDGGAAEVAVVLLQLGLEAAEQSESVGGRAGEPGQNFVLIEAADFFRAVLDDRFAERDLAVPGHDHFVFATDAEDGRGAYEAASGRYGVTLSDCNYWGVLFHERNFLIIAATNGGLFACTCSVRS